MTQRLTVVKTPSNFIPYGTVDLCGNECRCRVLLAFGSDPLILIGRDMVGGPLIWLKAPGTHEPGLENLERVVASNHLQPEAQRRGLKASVFGNGFLLELAGQPIIKVQEVSPQRALVSEVDLRPLKLTLYGNLQDGLYFGRTHLTRNRITADVAIRIN